MKKPNIYRTMIAFMDLRYKELIDIIEKRYKIKYSMDNISAAVRKPYEHGKYDHVRAYIVEIYADYLAGNLKE